MLSLHRSAQLMTSWCTTEVKSWEMGLFLLMHLGRLDRFCINSYNKWIVTWMNSYLNIFPCFSISRLEMLPLFLEPKLREKVAGRVWEESESVRNLKQLGSFSVTIGNQGANKRGSTFLASCTNNFLSAYFSFSSHPKAINLKQLLFKQQYVHLTYISPELIWGRWRWGRRWWQGRPRWRSTTCRTSRIDLPIRNCWFSLWAVVSQIYFLTKMSGERRSDCGVGGSKLWSQNRATACRAAKHMFETLSKGSCFYWRYLI